MKYIEILQLTDIVYPFIYHFWAIPFSETVELSALATPISAYLQCGRTSKRVK